MLNYFFGRGTNNKAPDTPLAEVLCVVLEDLQREVPDVIDKKIGKLVEYVKTSAAKNISVTDIRSTSVELDLLQCWNAEESDNSGDFFFRRYGPKGVNSHHEGPKTRIECHPSGTKSFGSGSSYGPTPLELAICKEIVQPDIMKKWVDLCVNVLSSPGLKITLDDTIPALLHIDFSQAFSERA